MNYMPEVAKMLGVEIGEEFYIKELPDIRCTIYNDGLYLYPIQDCICTVPSCDVTLARLLKGVITIRRKPWRPKLGEKYWCFTMEEGPICNQWSDIWMDVVYYKFGNCYKTKEEAEANIDKWAEFYKSDEVLEA